MNSGVSGIGMDSSLDENELRKFGSPDRFDDISSPFKSGRHTPFISSNKTKSKVKTKSKTKKKKPKKLKSQSKIIEPTIPKSKPALPSKRIEKNQTRTKKRIIAPKKKNIVQRKPVVEKSETKKPIKKKRPEIKDPTPGAKSLMEVNDLVRNVGKSTKDEMAEFERQVKATGLESLARQYPSAYRSALLHNVAKPSATTTTKNKKNTTNAISKRMEQDLQKYRKTYQILLKQHTSEVRQKAQQSKRQAKLILRGMDQDKKIDQIRTERLHQDLKREEKARTMERASREEVFVKKMFQDALKLEHERILQQKKAREDLQKQLDQEQLNRYESIQQQLIDQENMMKETLENQRREEKITRLEQRIALRELGTTLRKDYQNRINTLHLEYDQKHQKNLLNNQETISSMFNDLNTTLGDIGAQQVRSILTQSF